MPEYIEREATIREMKMDIEPPFKVVMKMPAADVVPRTEIIKLFEEFEDAILYYRAGIYTDGDLIAEMDKLRKKCAEGHICEES